MFLERGGVFTHETVPQWEATVASLLTACFRTHRYGQDSRRWRVDETLIKVNGQWRSMSRALDPGGNLLAVRLSQPRDLAAARAFFCSAHRIATRSPLPGTSDGYGSSPGAIRLECGPAGAHRPKRYANTLLEQSHRAIQHRLRPMLGCKRFGSAARFCHAHDEVRRFFRLSAGTHRPVPVRWQRQLPHPTCIMLRETLGAACPSPCVFLSTFALASWAEI